MRDEYDFSNARRASDVPALARLQKETGGKSRACLAPLTFMVKVTHADAQDTQEIAMWIAVCDALHLVTEAPTFAKLRERVWAVLPDILEVNGMGLDTKDVLLSFQYEDMSSASHFA